MFDMPTAILGNVFKTTTPFIDTTVNETLRQVFPFNDNYCLLQFFHSFEFSSVINSLPKGTPDSVIDEIKILAVWGPYVRLDEIDLLFLQVLHCVTSRVRRRAIMLKCPFVTAAFCFNIRLQCNNLSAPAHLRRSAAPNFYFSTHPYLRNYCS